MKGDEPGMLEITVQSSGGVVGQTEQNTGEGEVPT